MEGKHKKRRSTGITIVMVLCLMISFALIGSGVYLVFFKNQDAYERQDTERELADAYIDDLILKIRDPEAYAKKIEAQRQNSVQDNKEERQEEQETVEETEVSENVEEATGDITEEATEGITEEATEECPQTTSYHDGNYYERDGITYTPDYAKGVIDCELEVPSAKIRRGVYTGTWDEILYNLDIWMVTTARPDYVLGQTHYCIYGHNHTVQDLSFNKLQKVQVGEEFYLTAESGRYTYTITNVFAVTREDASKKYVDNFNHGADKCYIITCGRDDGVRNFRYLDLIVEGTLKEHISLEEYAEQIGK